MRNFIAVLSLFLMLFVPPVMAAGDTYISLGHHWGDYKDDREVKSDPGAIKLTVGKYLLPAVAIEAHLLKGAGSDSVKQSGGDTGASMEVDRTESLFLRGNLALSPQVNLYGLAGYTKGRIETSGGGFVTDTGKADGPSYGVGLEVIGKYKTFVSAEYIQYLDETEDGIDFEYNGFNINIGKRF